MIFRPLSYSCFLCVLLSGCTSFLSQGTGAAAGIAGTTLANKVTRNASVATGIGLGVQSIAQAGLQYLERAVHEEEQNAIAQAAGPLHVDEVADWRVRHTLPIEGDEQGKVAVSRIVGGDGFSCKEIVFSIAPPPLASSAPEASNSANGQPAPSAPSQFYTSMICNDGSAWRWAVAEPATPRWGALQ
ncbi:hypothetical protein O9649_00895 [Achromobacter dolens]|uniref:hypothetical protein n=1 Tax=Achromobacter dolens TaxID=1287738 RepID=UPI0011A71BA5|nr:hypothetical protein [Achromobacter dolens]MCZ8406330.1 hypothetical protein [Achromobacter dolens]